MAGLRKLEKLADFKRALKQNYGLGEGASYTPRIRVQDVKSHGHSGKIEGIKSGRIPYPIGTRVVFFLLG